MKHSSLLFLFVLAAASPLAAAAAAWSSRVSCGGSNGRYSSYAANSTYEANLHHLAAVLPAEASASHRRYASRAFGSWPNRLHAAWSCRRSDGGGDCATCIADAFKRVERECPFYREAFFFGANCTLRVREHRIYGSDVFGRNIAMVRPLVMGMMLQAFGLACLFLSFVQAWRHDVRKGNITRHTPLLPGDQ